MKNKKNVKLEIIIKSHKGLIENKKYYFLFLTIKQKFRKNLMHFSKKSSYTFMRVLGVFRK